MYYKDGNSNSVSKKAFTLIETLIGITLITVVVTAVSGLILSTLLSNQRNLHSLQATAFSAEGLEVMRHIRDSNWLQNYSWNGGAVEWGDDFSLNNEDPDDSLTFYLTRTGCNHNWCFSAQPGDGEYEQFLREIIVTHVLDDEGNISEDGGLEVTSRVTWRERGVDREVALSTYLTDWK